MTKQTKHQRKSRREFNNLCNSVTKEELKIEHITSSIINALYRVKLADQEADQAKGAQMQLFPPGTNYKAWKRKMYQDRLL